MRALQSVLTPIHPEGWKFTALFALGTLILYWIWSPLGVVGLILTGWCAYFFRDPPRVTPVRSGLVIAPADGLVQMIERASPPPELGMGDDPRTRVSIFMNVFDVHINRAPVDGRIEGLAYRPGKFLDASLDKASEENERMSIWIKSDEGRDIAMVQIAGLVARRILCEVEEGEAVRAGERIGLIRFGSRVDVYLDEGMEPLVIEGQRTIAGETVLADMMSEEPAREGAVR